MTIIILIDLSFNELCIYRYHEVTRKYYATIMYAIYRYTYLHIYTYIMRRITFVLIYIMYCKTWLLLPVLIFVIFWLVLCMYTYIYIYIYVYIYIYIYIYIYVYIYMCVCVCVCVCECVCVCVCLCVCAEDKSFMMIKNQLQIYAKSYNSYILGKE